MNASIKIQDWTKMNFSDRIRRATTLKLWDLDQTPEIGEGETSELN